MAHPIDHAKSAARRWGGTWEDYIAIEEWFDETKAWVGNSTHRMFRHHSEGIFECEKIFGTSFENSGEQHVKEDCFNYIPTAKEWIIALESKEKPLWMIRTLELKFDD